MINEHVVISLKDTIVSLLLYLESTSALFFKIYDLSQFLKIVFLSRFD